MKDTYFYPPHDKLGRLATAYGFFDGKMTRFPDKPLTDGYLTYSADYPYNGPKKLFSGGGGLVSTAEDYARFCQMMLDNGLANGKRLLSRKTVELMTHDQLGKIGPDQGFGLGFGVEGVKGPMDELGTPGSYGWAGFFYTSFVIDPKEQMIVIFMAQLHPAGDVTIDKRVKTLAYQAIND
jgi:CubicO group peptidase (beta-lactamase class C family)